MGGACCIPDKAREQDLRDKKGDKKGNDRFADNAFKAQPLEVEFKVENRDSIGMVAKEHTAMLMGHRGSQTGNQHIMSSMGNVENNSVSSRGNSMVVRGQDSHEKTEGKAAVKDEEPNRVVTDFQNDEQDLSFGEKARPLMQNEVSYEDEMRNGSYDQVQNEQNQNQTRGHMSVVSVRDIQDIEDKVPASPRTTWKN